MYGKMKFLFFGFFLLFVGNIFFVKAEEEACKDAKHIITSFKDKLENMQHGQALLINLKNYYCPTCNIYMSTWNYLKEHMEKIEGDNFVLFTFDCACSLLMPYCASFEVRYYPTFRILYPVYAKDANNELVAYIEPMTPVGGDVYEGVLTLAYREVDRMYSIYSIQHMIKQILCSNIVFNNTLLKTCLTDEPEVADNMVTDIMMDIHAQNHLRTHKWPTVDSKKDIEHDIFIGLLFALKMNVSSLDVVQYANIKTFLLMFETLEQMFPHLEKDIRYITKKIKGLSYPVDRKKWKKIVSGMKIKSYRVQDQLSFKVCEPGSLLCSFWLLYHKISVYCVLYDEKNFAFYKELIDQYTVEYLNCQPCIDHFLSIQKTCVLGACNINSAESLVIFLWRLHNSVTLRTVCEAIANDVRYESSVASPKSKFLNVDVAFPSANACKTCRTGYGMVSITLDFVLKYLRSDEFLNEQFDAIDAFDVTQVVYFLINYYY